MKFNSLLRTLIFALTINLSWAQTNALNFDGINDKVDINHSPTLNFASNNKFSIEAWFKTTTPGFRILVSNRIDVSPFTGYEFMLNSGAVDFSICGSLAGNAMKALTVNNTFNDGNWHHAVAVYKGNTNAATVDLYVDGVLQAKTTPLNSLSTPITNTNLVTIGARQGVSAYNFNGSVDEVRIWNKELCAAEIVARKNCQLMGNEPNLVAYYNFNQGIAAGFNTVVTLPDVSGTGNTGTLTNFALSGPTSNWVVSTVSVSGTCSYSYVSIAGITSICPGASTTLTATGAASYSWNFGPTTPTVILTPTATTVYTLSTIDGFSCGGITTVTVNVTPNIPISIVSSNSAVCMGGSVSLSASGASTYSWSNAATGSSIVVTPTNTTSYFVTGTNNITGCIGNNSISVVVNSLPSVAIVNPFNSICIGQTATLAASGANNYLWNTLATTPGILISPSVTTNYYVTGTNTLTGCSNSNSISIIVNSLPTVAIVSSTSSICAGQTVSLTANGANIYLWNTLATLPGIIVTPTVTTNYSVIGTNSVTGCSSADSLSIFVNPLPVISITGSSNTICAGQTVNLTASGANNYLWNTFATTSGIIVTPNITTNYSVTGTNSVTGCSGTSSLSVIVNSLPTVTISSSSNSICVGQTATLTAGGANNYLWNTLANTPGIVINPSVTTNYSVTGTNSINGCANTSTISVLVNKCVGIIDNQTEYTPISVYPNPSSGNVFIKSLVNINLIIINDLGQVVENITLNELNERTYAVNRLAEGIYFIVSTNKDNFIKQKLLIIK